MKPNDIFEVQEGFSLLTVRLKFNPEHSVTVESTIDCGYEEQKAIGLLWQDYGQEIIDYIRQSGEDESR